MLMFLTVLIMLGVAYVYWNEGLFTAFTMFVNVFLAGFIAFNFWEPLANQLEGTNLETYGDALCLVILFSIALGLLRFVVNQFTPTKIEFPGLVQNLVGAVFGLATGYLAAGFLVCALQTLPWHENFMGFDPTYASDQGMRDVLPSDRVWLALMHRASAYALANRPNPNPGDSISPYDKYQTFDPKGSFELRYWRYRRYGDNRPPLPYRGEFDKALGRGQ